MRRAIFVPLLSLGLLLPAAPALAAEPPCPNEALRAENSSTNLPDCRAYELVSPADKDGGSIGVLNFDFHNQLGDPTESNADGSEIEYTDEIGQYTSTRLSGGWSTQLGDNLSPEEALIAGSEPPPLLPSVADGTKPTVLEETPTGSRTYFLDESDLVPGASTASTNEPDLYAYTVPTPTSPQGHLEDLTVDTNLGPHGEAEHADVQGILGVGGEGVEAGSYVYFVANGILGTNSTSRGGCVPDIPSTSSCNLYLAHDGAITFITALSSRDEESTYFIHGEEGSKFVHDWSSPSARTAEVSPDGRYLAFGSNFELTGQDAAGPVGEQPEIFRYAAEAVEKHERPIVCVSCSPVSGAVVPDALLVPSPQTLIDGSHRQRYMLNNGRVFFDTHGALVPQDTNGQTDVYEWENGAAHLISSGTSTAHSIFTDASMNGSDVFFTTAQSLVPQDTDAPVGQDGIVDLYDAREGGGFPPPPEAACAVEAQCSGASSTAPVVPSLPSLTDTALEPPGPSTNTTGVTSKPKPTKAQLLASALRTCSKDRKKAKRRACEKQARAKYAPRKAKKAKKNGRAKR